MGAASVARRDQRNGTATGVGMSENSNWHSARAEGLQDLDGFLEGEVDMEEEDIVELEPDEEEQPPEVLQRWRLMGRYISQRRPNTDDMTDHFNVKVWKLRSGVNFAPLGKNWFKITFFSKGDFNFVARGGPWIYRGYPLLVTKIQGDARPSETELNTVPLWVQVYDMPWNRQKKYTARLIGDRLGKFLEAVLDVEGNSPYDFLRVRVSIPVDRKLRSSITTQVKGQAGTATFPLRYERVPYFCFWCGYIGHDDTECEKKRIGVPSVEYDSRLRCSPVCKFECRQVYAPPKQHPQVRKELNFSSSDDNSATLGVPADRRRNRRVGRHTGDHIPDRVDAWDGFEEREEGSAEVDAELAAKINHMNLPVVRKEATTLWNRVHTKPAGRGGQGHGVQQGVHYHNVIESAVPLAMYPSNPSASYLAGLGSEEMIPPICGLNSMIFSADTVMSDADSILGKRGSEHQECESEDRSRALTVMGNVGTEGKLKKGPSLVFLCETRLKAEKVRRLRGRLGLRGFAGVDSDGLCGGLALFWNDQLIVEVQSMCERFIDVHVRLSENEPQWASLSRSMNLFLPYSPPH
uniref:Uncharacterized protein n=1 Tax=Avena sativa TaxID=4498 RepID=A0ACD5ZTU9_AVESA